MKEKKKTPTNLEFCIQQKYPSKLKKKNKFSHTKMEGICHQWNCLERNAEISSPEKRKIYIGHGSTKFPFRRTSEK